jgi:hypothetical protein
VELAFPGGNVGPDDGISPAEPKAGSTGVE